MILSPNQLPAESYGLEAQVADIFGPDGLLSKSKNFEFRPQQQAMATGVARALEAGKNCVVEAGTGVGKSLAYLIPAILHGEARVKKAIISTHTINLQEQLTEKDLPMLQRILPVDFSYTMLKGRGNYLCTRRLHRALAARTDERSDHWGFHLPDLMTWNYALDCERGDGGVWSGGECQAQPLQEWVTWVHQAWVLNGAAEWTAVSDLSSP